MREAAPPAIPNSLVGELWALVRLYRGEPVFPEGDALDGTETAVVLGTQVLSGGRPSGPLQARARHAAQLYARGEVRLVIATGGVGKHPPSEAEVAGRLLREAGVPEEAILLESEAKSTRESARLVAAMTREKRIHGLTVVTDPLHCVRVVGAFRVEGVTVRVSPVYSSPMWRKAGLRRGQFLRETAALLWYNARQGRARPEAGH